MPTNTNTNYNHISVKTDSMVKMLEQLSKLGVFKSKKSKPRKSKVVDEIKQESDMVGYVKPTPGGQFGLRTPLTQNQLEDLQRKQEATIARLSGEVQQQRLADIEAQQGQRFADIERLGGIINPLLERFRSAQEPGAGVYDPFTIPDVQEERFTQTLNEGGPEAVEQPQGGEIYADEEEEIIALPEPRLAPREAIEAFKLTPNIMTEIDVYWGFGKIPETRSVAPLREYLSRINRDIGSDYPTNVSREELLKNIRAGLREAYRKIPE